MRWLKNCIDELAKELDLAWDCSPGSHGRARCQPVYLPSALNFENGRVREHSFVNRPIDFGRN